MYERERVVSTHVTESFLFQSICPTNSSIIFAWIDCDRRIASIRRVHKIYFQMRNELL